MIDSHCHLDHEPLYSNINNVIKRSKENGLNKILTISTNSKSFENIKKIINLDAIIYGSIGIHPHETSNDKMSKDFIVDRLFAANKYFNDQEPWKKKDERLRLNTIVYTALELIRKITILLYPVMPETSLKVLNGFDETENSIDFTSIDNNEFLKKDLKINKLDILFKKIEK